MLIVNSIMAALHHIFAFTLTAALAYKFIVVEWIINRRRRAPKMNAQPIPAALQSGDAV
ncbi:MAG TPA: hypothetical protein PLF42_08965 [Anaerolineales bacterium]|nr:hypothetical protein [Anaerolineales bacterium]